MPDGTSIEPAMVETVTVTVAGLVPSKATVPDGVKAQDAYNGTPLQARVTGWLNPLRGVTVRV